MGLNVHSVDLAFGAARRYCTSVKRAVKNAKVFCIVRVRALPRRNQVYAPLLDRFEVLLVILIPRWGRYCMRRTFPSRPEMKSLSHPLVVVPL